MTEPQKTNETTGRTSAVEGKATASDPLPWLIQNLREKMQARPGKTIPIQDAPSEAS